MLNREDAKVAIRIAAPQPQPPKPCASALCVFEDDGPQERLALLAPDQPPRKRRRLSDAMSFATAFAVLAFFAFQNLVRSRATLNEPRSHLCLCVSVVKTPRPMKLVGGPTITAAAPLMSNPSCSPTRSHRQRSVAPHRCGRPRWRCLPNYRLQDQAVHRH